MRMHIEIDDDVVERIDRITGPRGRSRFVRLAIEQALDEQDRWALILSAAGGISDGGHEWDADPAAWIRAQREGDPHRGG